MIQSITTSGRAAHPDVDPAEIEFQRLKTAVHEELVESLDLSTVGEMDHDLLVQEIRRLAADAWKALDLNGLARVDFLMDARHQALRRLDVGGRGFKVKGFAVALAVPAEADANGVLQRLDTGAWPFSTHFW